MLILEIENLNRHFKKRSDVIKAVDGISLTVDKGEFVSIMGRSGSGKTTLLHLIGGLEKPSSGAIRINETDITQLEDEEMSVFRRRNIGFVFQSYNLLPMISVEDNIAMPAGIDGKVLDKGFFQEIVSILNIKDKLTDRPNILSGGEQQRVAIARAMIMKPSLLLADEPTGNLDRDTSDDVIRLLLMMQNRFGQTIVMVTHDTTMASRTDRILHMEKGIIEERRNE